MVEGFVPTFEFGDLIKLFRMIATFVSANAAM
jgi:hypothetical protein